MMRNYDQTKVYNVTFGKGGFDPEMWEFRMGKHPTQYGNGSSVAVFMNGQFKWMEDTRYDREIMKDFGKWCMQYLEGCFAPQYEPKITEI